MNSTSTLQAVRPKPSKLVIAVMVAAITAMVGTAGAANAAPAGKPSKDTCTKDNFGKCVREWAKNNGGNGYGGNSNTTININPNIIINGSNNNVVIKIIFG